MSKILVVDGEAEILDLICRHLTHDGHECLCVQDGVDMMAIALDQTPDLIVMDVLLPTADGMALLEELHVDARTATIPIIVLSTKADVEDKILALRLGAEDYLTKPFSATELTLRISAVLRRSETTRKRVGVFVLDRIHSEVIHGGARIKLSLTEFKLLDALCTNPTCVRPRESLLREVWGYSGDNHSRTLDTHIKRLRRKLGHAGEMILNVKGVGYKVATGARS